MSVPPKDRRPPMAAGMEWVSQITSVALMMALPAGAGYWVDQQIGTAPWLLVLGAGVGLGVGLMQLLRMTDRSRRNQSNRESSGLPRQDDV